MKKYFHKNLIVAETMNSECFHIHTVWYNLYLLSTFRRMYHRNVHCLFATDGVTPARYHLVPGGRAYWPNTQNIIQSTEL